MSWGVQLKVNIDGTVERFPDMDDAEWSDVIADWCDDERDVRDGVSIHRLNNWTYGYNHVAGTSETVEHVSIKLAECYVDDWVEVQRRLLGQEAGQVNTEQAADLAVLELAVCGDVERASSSQSESAYVTVTNAEGFSIKIRFSDHELPPTYGLRDGWPDIDAWVTVQRPMASHWAVAIRRAGRNITQYEWEPASAEVHAGLQERKAQIELAKRQAEAEKAMLARDAQRKDENQRLLDADGSGHLTGASRKRRLKKLKEAGR